MVKLARGDLRTLEVLEFEGLHLFHDQLSSCSQKVRIVLNLKKLPWISHPVSLLKHENITSHYLGINPRGLLPTLVHDGEVHIESNDILLHLEAFQPDPELIPRGKAARASLLLDLEDNLHMDLRTLTFGFLLRPPVPKSREDLDRYARGGSGSVAGRPDRQRHVEIAFWQSFIQDDIADDAARASASRFRMRFGELEHMLGEAPFLMGSGLSAVDIAWFIYAERLRLAGYPFARLHPGLTSWAVRMSAVPEVATEVALPVSIAAAVATAQAAQVAEGRTLAAVCEL